MPPKSAAPGRSTMNISRPATVSRTSSRVAALRIVAATACSTVSRRAEKFVDLSRVEVFVRARDSAITDEADEADVHPPNEIVRVRDVAGMGCTNPPSNVCTRRFLKRIFLQRCMPSFNIARLAPRGW
jgi:hypothetical protein